MLIIYPLILLCANQYKSVSYNALHEIKRLIFSVSILFSIFTLYTFFIKDNINLSRLVFMFSWIASIFIIPLFRYFIRFYFARFSWWGSDVVIFGAGNTGVKIYNIIKSNPNMGLKVKKFFDRKSDAIIQIDGIEVISGIRNAEKYLAQDSVRYGILAIPSLPNKELTISALSLRAAIYNGVAPSIVLAKLKLAPATNKIFIILF